VTDTTTSAASQNAALSAMKLPQLQALASELGVSGTAKMRKSDLVEAIKNGGAPVAAPAAAPVAEKAPRRSSRAKAVAVEEAPQHEDAADRARRAALAVTEAAASEGVRVDAPRAEGQAESAPAREPRQGGRQQQSRGSQEGGRQARANQDDGQQDGGQRSGAQQPRANQADADNDYDDDRSGRRRRGRGRGRGRNGERPVGSAPIEAPDEDDVRDDEELTPVGGIVDVLDNYAFIRTTGYLPGKSDVYISMNQVRKYGVRRGDAVTGTARAPRPGERGQRQKFSALGEIHTVNGLDVESAKARPDFGDLTPLYPQERLHLETDPRNLTNRVIDLVAPIGKGQRGLIVSPPKAGKTLVMQSIANAIAVNNPEVHLMIVLVDERPEEVTDFQRSVKGEVIASTFDRPAADHTMVAELAIERAKRLVEMGQDVMILLDGITRLGRAYNLAAPASGRILSGGVDSSALYPPKRFFGAARNIEHGGSLTILATALVETGSKMDEVIFEEFKGTGNMEIKLSRQLADRRIFPAVDVNASGTRREEILVSPEELKVSWKLRRVLSGLETQAAAELLLGRLKDNRTNAEFLMQVAKTTPDTGLDDK
jgi:transcription termination factor Rho